MRPRGQDAGRLVSTCDAGPEAGPESAAIDAALAAWRRKGAEILITVNAAVHLPAVLIVALGHGPPAGPVAKAAAFAAYFGLLAAALLRRVRQRTRLLTSFFSLYLVTAVANLTALRGPYAQVGLVVYPVLVLVLLGAPAARIAVVASATILVAAPFLRVLPVVVRMLGTAPARLAESPDVVWMQAAGLAAFLAVVMIVLDRFQQFLLDALRAQCRALAERQKLEREIAAISDRERRRLGQELHDGVCQQVTAALLRCQAMARRLERGGTLSGADFEPLSSLLGDTIDDAHNVARGLCPLEPHPDALAPALRAMTKRMEEVAAVSCEFRAVGDVRVPDPEAAQHLYRIAQEALSNSVRHAKPSRIRVELRNSNGELALHIEDDGAGMPAAVPGEGMGLRTMAYRAQIMRGELTVDAAPSGGTRVVCHVPLAAGPPTKGCDG